MTTTTAMLETYPKPINLDRQLLAATIDALTECAATCTSCADACLSEDMVADLTTCISTYADLVVIPRACDYADATRWLADEPAGRLHTGILDSTGGGSSTRRRPDLPK